MKGLLHQHPVRIKKIKFMHHEIWFYNLLLQRLDVLIKNRLPYPQHKLKCE
jgi:hypothetical protein